MSPPCRALVGINESGKSNILKALSLLDPDTKSSDEDLRDFLPKEDPDQDADVTFVFAFTKDERTIHYNSLLKAILVKNRKRSILTKSGKPLSLAQFCEEKTQGLLIADLRSHKKRATIWRLGRDYEIVEGWKKPKPDCPPTIQVQTEEGKLALKKLNLVWADDCPPEAHQYLVDADAEDVNNAVWPALAQTVNASLPKCLYWTYSEGNLLPGKIDMESFKTTPNSCQPLKHMFALAGFNDVGKALTDAGKKTNGVRNLLNRVSDRTTLHIRSVWKEYQSVKVTLSQNGPNIEANFEDRYNNFDFSRRSDGFKRFVTFLLLVSARIKTNDLTNTLYLHDEPDTGLHPSGARYLRDELIRISAVNYVVFSTHSPFMIDKELIGRHLIVEKKNEVTTVKEVTDSNITDEEVIYNAVGASIFDNLNAKNILFEGWRDKRLFEVAIAHPPHSYKHLKDNFKSIGVCHARGAKDIGRITPMLELAQRSWIVLSDSDKPAREQQKLYRGAGKWVRYDEVLPSETVITGEDFVKAETLNPILQRISTEYPGLDVLPSDDLKHPSGKLAVIRRWLHTATLPSDTVNEIIEDLKQVVFDHIKPSDIEEKYFRLLAELRTRID